MVVGVVAQSARTLGILKLKIISKYHFNSKKRFTCYYLYLALKIKIKFKNEFQILKFQIKFKISLFIELLWFLNEKIL
ncbi:hypothetical protein BpHYR1_011119 [Brachionus plicatilis]|uniref:Uncharacterized protein n=1 Tax=Brachionus plicatilis TaxID=10195 RepID=A0A3M7R9Y6_BRAPC|nr:hypothetical protein BpHYR1_011119 [Brachionus plicatilis]